MRPIGSLFAAGAAAVSLALAGAPTELQAAPAPAPALGPNAAPAAKVLAPSGRLRVGVYAGAPTSLVRGADGQLRGVTYDLGRELARRLGAPVEIVEFQRVAQVVEALGKGEVDFTVTNATPARAQLADFSDPILDIEQGYLVPAGSPIKALAEVDRPGAVIGVSEGSTSQANLTRVLKNARLVAAPSVDAAIGLMAAGEVQAYATNKSILFEMSDRLPGSHVLDGALGRESMALAVPKGREAGLPFLRAFAAEAVARGLVDQAVQRAGLRGSVRPR